MVDVAHVLSKCAILGAMMPSGLEIGLMTASLVVQGRFPLEFYGEKIKERIHLVAVESLQVWYLEENMNTAPTTFSCDFVRTCGLGHVEQISGGRGGREL